jgi:hypothetical protein
MLNDLMFRMSEGVKFFGYVAMGIGVVIIGANWKDSASNGGAIGAGIGFLVGGAIITAAGFYFAGLDTSWANAARDFLQTVFLG